ncbi:MAG: DUF4886 domain-containing protein [Clostridia bacterium]|nr:DUF4886 domain-containing protein [Clostridia bacterium]
MNILAIGNSFSQDAMRYLHRIARADGVDLRTTNLYVGGCPLWYHYRNTLGDMRAYELQSNGEETGFTVSLEEALLNRKWDVVTLQQASHESFKPETYQPYASEVAAFVRKYQPKARFLWHQTWAYEEGSDRLHHVAGFEHADDMIAAVKTAYALACEQTQADGIIPSGEMFRWLLANGIEKIHRDTFHASLGLGRYALGLLWYKTITGRAVTGNPFSAFDEPIAQADIELVQRYVDSL